MPSSARLTAPSRRGAPQTPSQARSGHVGWSSTARSQAIWARRNHAPGSDRVGLRPAARPPPSRLTKAAALHDSDRAQLLPQPTLSTSRAEPLSPAHTCTTTPGPE